MNIAMFTNTFTPHVGGVARSVEAFSAEYRRMGHEVLVVAPVFEGAPAREKGVVRFPAIQNFNGSDFSVPVPVPGRLDAAFDEFHPDIVHSHHPFLLGDTALRAAAQRGLPVVFTHHTMYERYTHYVPGDSPAMKRAAIELAVGYCNLCDAVIAPSESLARVLRRRGVETPIVEIPTGVDVEHFAAGNGERLRRRLGIDAGAFVVGHVGRLAPEKNLEFLAAAVAQLVAARPCTVFLVAGRGPSEKAIRDRFEELGVADRLMMAGVLDRDEVPDACAAMDVFAFASQSETQGMVLTEAMAAGVPVVAVDAPGAREVVEDRANGRLLPAEDQDDFVGALAWIADLSDAEREQMAQEVAATAERFSISATASQALDLYRSLRFGPRAPLVVDDSAWVVARRRLAKEWRIWRNLARAVSDSLTAEET